MNRWARRYRQAVFSFCSSEVKKFATYRLRYFIDVWAGGCLWSANDSALERFGYPVSLEDLGLSDNALQFGKTLIWRLQDEVTWESIGYGVPHDEQLDIDSGTFLIILRNELGPAFEILDERH
jgi:hypothetical protein